MNNATVISQIHHSFIEGRSTVDAWKVVVIYVKRCPSKYILALFIDVSGAFDNVSWNSILRRLVEAGSRDLELWESYFRETEGNIQSIIRGVSRGCPQRSISIASVRKTWCGMRCICRRSLHYGGRKQQNRFRAERQREYGTCERMSQKSEFGCGC
ncbi:hypothetical protein Zmor_001524 [Zophobas morio]|mgnify:FL=1|uniref:Reverse transcriptase domain-containing protein n=1 Tax=Zophobas morio TaxID=2755281 RepID=A0AA38MSE3_9CUCU|nr:hypothetical protein Zmor_001524 [Zophobas morio]